MTLTMPTEEQVARMTKVFEMVKPVGNWKNPIQAMVPKAAATEAEISEAVVFFCGGFPVVESKTDHWMVTGAGYYVWVGA